MRFTTFVLTACRLPLSAALLAACALLLVPASDLARAQGTEFVKFPTSPEGTGAGAADVAVGDLNGDGDADLVVANGASGGVTILLGDGTGDFSEPPTSPESAGTEPYALVIDDFDGNDKPDVAVANSGSDDVTILLGSGTGNFTSTAAGPGATGPEPVGDRPWRLVSGDFDEDDNRDLAVANVVDENVTVLLGDGAGDFAAGGPVGTVGPRAMALGDFDEDGNEDLAVLGADTTILLGDGAGTFAEPAHSPLDDGGDDVDVADFNRDGNLDLVVGVRAYEAIVYVYAGDGTGGFELSDYAVVGDVASLVVGALDSDGNPDVAVGISGFHPVANHVPATVTAVFGDGAGGFKADRWGDYVSDATSHVTVALGDFNSDGRPDIAAAVAGSGEIVVFRNRPAGGEDEACSDGLDNDGDGKVDHPADSGCTSVSDTDETDPPADGSGAGDGGARPDPGSGPVVPVTPPAGQPVVIPVKAADLALLPGTRGKRRCGSRRKFKIHLREPPEGVTIAEARVLLNGKRVKVVRGTRLTAPIDLRGLPKGRAVVKIKITLADGRVLNGRRVYRPCATKKRKGRFGRKRGG